LNATGLLALLTRAWMPTILEMSLEARHDERIGGVGEERAAATASPALAACHHPGAGPGGCPDRAGLATLSGGTGLSRAVDAAPPGANPGDDGRAGDRALYPPSRRGGGSHRRGAGMAVPGHPARGALPDHPGRPAHRVQCRRANESLQRSPARRRHDAEIVDWC
jgi:hypothetical protein